VRPLVVDGLAWRSSRWARSITHRRQMVSSHPTGLPWSTAWGTSWAWAASEITPNADTSFWEWEGPRSGTPVAGDLDREGHRVRWATRNDVIPASGGGHQHRSDSSTPTEAATATLAGPPARPVALDVVRRAADNEGMLAGYTINAPVDLLPDPEDPEAPTEPFYGSFVVFNPWPSDMANQGALYLDQFSGSSLARSTPDTWGKGQPRTAPPPRGRAHPTGAWPHRSRAGVHLPAVGSQPGVRPAPRPLLHPPPTPTAGRVRHEVIGGPDVRCLLDSVVTRCCICCAFRSEERTTVTSSFQYQEVVSCACCALLPR
jgi:hypothetical protein